VRNPSRVVNARPMRFIREFFWCSCRTGINHHATGVAKGETGSGQPGIVQTSRLCASRSRRIVCLVEHVSSSFDGVPVAFDVSGSGSSTIVFIHGLVGDHNDFASQIDHFARTHQLVAIDLPGSGESGRGRSAWTMEAFGEDVATVVNHLGVDQAVLVGHSLGAM
jgi:predicted alpha/beta-fold hydrolase